MAGVDPQLIELDARVASLTDAWLDVVSMTCSAGLETAPVRAGSASMLVGPVSYVIVHHVASGCLAVERRSSSTRRIRLSSHGTGRGRVLRECRCARWRCVSRHG